MSRRTHGGVFEGVVWLWTGTTAGVFSLGVGVAGAAIIGLLITCLVLVSFGMSSGR